MGHMVTQEGGSKHKAQPKLLVISFKASGYKAKSKLEWCSKKSLHLCYMKDLVRGDYFNTKFNRKLSKRTGSA